MNTIIKPTAYQLLNAIKSIGRSNSACRYTNKIRRINDKPSNRDNKQVKGKLNRDEMFVGGYLRDIYNRLSDKDMLVLLSLYINSFTQSDLEYYASMNVDIFNPSSICIGVEVIRTKSKQRVKGLVNVFSLYQLEGILQNYDK